MGAQPTTHDPHEEETFYTIRGVAMPHCVNKATVFNRRNRESTAHRSVLSLREFGNEGSAGQVF